MKNETQSRREFFKEAAKKTLPILGMAVMAMAFPSTLQSCKKISLGCDDVCTNACKTTCKTTCVGGCSGSCSNACTGCGIQCSKNCSTSCFNTCKSGCGTNCKKLLR